MNNNRFTFEDYCRISPAARASRRYMRIAQRERALYDRAMAAQDERNAEVHAAQHDVNITMARVYHNIAKVSYPRWMVDDIAGYPAMIRERNAQIAEEILHG